VTITETQLRERLTGLGGSDCAVALGLSPWKTRFQLYLEKRGEAPPVAINEAMRWGTILEPIVLAEYERRTGRSILAPTTILRHPTHAFMVANFDGFVEEDGRIVEAKTARVAEGWGEPGTDEIPPHYLLQTMHYLAVAERELADVVVLIGGQDFRIYEVARDEELIAMIVDGEARFWEHVERAEPPEPMTLEEASQRYPISRGGQVVATPEIMDACRALQMARVRIDQHTQDKDKAELAIKRFMADTERLVSAAVWS
jgi:putative phage-type endonuclease